MKQPSAILVAWGGWLTAALIVGCGPHVVAPPAGEPITDVSSSPAPCSACCQVPAEACLQCVVEPGPEASDPAGYRRSRWLPPIERADEGVLSLRVIDQEGKPHDLPELCDRPTALSFIYTRCTNPNKCPRVVTEMANLHALLKAESLDTQVRLLVMTYDPEHDTPARLKQYGEQHGLGFTQGVLMLQPDSQQKDRLLDKLQVAVNYGSSGVNLHGVQLFLFDRQGRFVRRYQSVFWENQEVLGDLKQLALEGAADTTLGDNPPIAGR